MKKSHILIIVLAGALLLSFNVFTTIKFYSLRADLDKQGIININNDMLGFDVETTRNMAHTRSAELWDGIEGNTKRILENLGRIYDIEDYLNIKKGYIKKEKGE